MHNERIIDRFDEYMVRRGLNDNKVTTQCNISVGLLGKARSGKSDLGKTTVAKILIKYQDLNKVWLLTGEGEMLKIGGSTTTTTTTTEQTTYVPLLPISAQAGTLDYFTQSVSAQECEQIISPIRSVDFAVPVTGDSMQPEYPSGSKILVKRINADAFIEWGRCYVLDTLNGIVIKRIMPATDHEKVKCVSINPDYPPFDVDKSDIRAMYRVLMLLSEK